MQSENGGGAEWDRSYTPTFSAATIGWDQHGDDDSDTFFSTEFSIHTVKTHSSLVDHLVKLERANSSCNCSNVLQGEVNHVSRLYILSRSCSWPKRDYRAHSKYCNLNMSRAGSLEGNGK